MLITFIKDRDSGGGEDAKGATVAFEFVNMSFGLTTVVVVVCCRFFFISNFLFFNIRLLRSRKGNCDMSSPPDVDVPSPGVTPSAKHTDFLDKLKKKKRNLKDT